jgi:hypothetical protein
MFQLLQLTIDRTLVFVLHERVLAIRLAETPPVLMPADLLATSISGSDTTQNSAAAVDRL